MAVANDVFIGSLIAPDWSIPPEDRLFTPFIGSWDLAVCWYDGDGLLTRQEAGEWHFAIVLGGRAVQDVWIVPPRGRHTSAPGYEYGTSLRFFDEGSKAWRCTWVGPIQSMVRTFIARRAGDRIVMETEPDATPALRWTFYDIEENGFRWQNEVCEPRGWRIQQRFHAQRRTNAK